MQVAAQIKRLTSESLVFVQGSTRITFTDRIQTKRFYEMQEECKGALVVQKKYCQEKEFFGQDKKS